MPFLLAHLSDPHLGPLVQPRLRQLAGKRLTGYVNYVRHRRTAHDMEALAALVADMLAQKPDHIAMTGDLVNIALPGEFNTARLFMERLGAPDYVSFTPGNHDAYVPSAMPLIARTFAPWATGDDAAKASYPYLRRRGDVALIGVSTAIPTGPFLATGAVGAAQRARVGELLAQAKAEGLARVVMIHHPPYLAGASRTRGLIDAVEFEALLREQGADLVVHGHNHRFSCVHLPGPGGRGVPVVGVASASAAGRVDGGKSDHRAAYHLFTIGAEGGRPIAGRMRGLLPGRTEVGNMGEIPL